MASCGNCGKPGFDATKLETICQFCGFKAAVIKQLPEITLVFCEGCGATLSQNCPVHEERQQRKVDYVK